jgi:hypothetical protein
MGGRLLVSKSGLAAIVLGIVTQRYVFYLKPPNFSDSFPPDTVLKTTETTETTETTG